MFNSIVTTMDKYEHDVYLTGGILDTTKQKGCTKEYQRVIAVGSMVKDIKVGDIVLIDPKNYRVLKHEKGSLKDGVITDNPIIGYNIPIIHLNGVEHMLLKDNDVTYVVQDYEEEEDPKPASVVAPPTDIIV